MSVEAVLSRHAKWHTLVGDVRETLRSVPDGCAQTCVTSPPYFGLRDYGAAGQIGQEQSPAEYVAAMVAVMRDVRRVLADDGTLWLNLGDSYAGGEVGRHDGGRPATVVPRGAGGALVPSGTSAPMLGKRRQRAPVPGVKQKDLLGIPWSVAEALRAPYYAGRIVRERDRAWIAAMIDGEGTICGFEHERADDGSTRTGVNIFITNTSDALLAEAMRIWPASRSEHCTPGDGHFGTRPTERWIVHGAENKTLFLREVYPYLIAKKAQAVMAYNLATLMIDAKRLGHSPQRDAVREKRATLVRLMSDANHARAVDVPSWCAEPPSVEEPGWYLRSDIVWSKLNPMPEPVTDRPTRAHEYVFLLTKRPRYFYDADAIRDRLAVGTAEHFAKYHATEIAAPKAAALRGNVPGHRNRNSNGGLGAPVNGRNARDVWTITPEPFAEAHFATMPPELARRCILAGSRKGDVVLDPFGGAATTAYAALREGRRALLCELNPDYVEIQRRRLAIFDADAVSPVRVEAADFGPLFGSGA